tara:strand:- start:200 stop:1897 length:1698 start_codon:yes stop_codon:yes gene_type:complete
MDLSGIIILPNKIYNNDSNIREFQKYYKNNIKYIRSLVYTAQEYCNYNDRSLSSIDKNLFVNDPLFRKNTKNKNNIISDNSFRLFYFINTSDKLIDASFQEHIYDNSNNIIDKITELWYNTISYETVDISNIYHKYNKSLLDFITTPPWIGLPSSDISWDLINVNLNTGYSINQSIQDICSNLSAVRACVLVNNSQDINLIQSSRSEWDQSVYRILAEDVKHFHAPHITEYNKDREIHRNIYWADISGMDIPLGKIQDPSTCIPIWVQLKLDNNGGSQSISKDKEIQYISNFKQNRWYLLSLLSDSGLTILENVQQYMSGLYPNKIWIPNNSEYDNSYINITDFDLSINQYIQGYNNNVVKNRYNIDSIPAWIYIGNNREPLPSLNKISIFKQQTEILITLPSMNELNTGYYYGKHIYDEYTKLLPQIRDANLNTYLNLENIPKFGIGNLFSIEFKTNLSISNIESLNQYNNIILSNNDKFIYIVNNKDSLLPDQLLYNASSDNQQKEYIILNNMPDNLPDISNIYINLEDSSGNIILYDARNIYNDDGGNIIDICNLDINTYAV